MNESKLQIACVRWFDYSYPKLKMNFFSIPSEGARTPANGARMKAQGRRAGVADMFLAVTSIDGKGSIITEIKHGLFIEFKFGKGKQSETQLAFQAAVEKQGYKYEVVSDFDSFKNLIESYLK